MKVLIKIVAIITASVVSWAVVTTMYNMPSYLTSYIVIGSGIMLFLIGFLSNIRRNSPISVGAINRGEFYGVVVVILGAFFYLNTRIDTLFTLLAK